ncbi:type IV pilin protein [Roseateles amylovorans]|uniref:Type IV pilin protein n=1 Tax=Roseateles amylovorans TaxID=2978473 RepID=A0ABY6B6C9_9BURK|nr:type IV pilin protein [Roseateles amylovorans]UXH80306.1 type IV pilin protein [Roseateles amylovorans]
MSPPPRIHAPAARAHRRQPSRLTAHRGLTLIELLVALLLVGVLLSIALPSYRQHVLKAFRAEAIQALSQLQVTQERFRSRHPRYASTLEELSAPSLTPQARYRLQLVEASASGFILEALALGDQVKDRHCQRLRLRLEQGESRRQAFDAEGNDRSDHCWPV